MRIWPACRWASSTGIRRATILSVITYDVDTVNQSLSADLLQILQTVVTVTVSLGMMLSIAPKLVLIFCVTIPATIFFTRYITARVRPLFRAAKRRPGGAQWFYGGDDERPEDHQGLWPGGGSSGGL